MSLITRPVAGVTREQRFHSWTTSCWLRRGSSANMCAISVRDQDVIALGGGPPAASDTSQPLVETAAAATTSTRHGTFGAGSLPPRTTGCRRRKATPRKTTWGLQCFSAFLPQSKVYSVQTRLVSGKAEALVIRLLPSPLSSKMDSSRT